MELKDYYLEKLDLKISFAAHHEVPNILKLFSGTFDLSVNVRTSKNLCEIYPDLFKNRVLWD